MAMHLRRWLLYPLQASTVCIVGVVLTMASARSADAQLGYSRAVSAVGPGDGRVALFPTHQDTTCRAETCARG